jgi:hypothetical protein
MYGENGRERQGERDRRGEQGDAWLGGKKLIVTTAVVITGNYQ